MLLARVANSYAGGGHAGSPRHRGFEDALPAAVRRGGKQAGVASPNPTCRSHRASVLRFVRGWRIGNRALVVGGLLIASAGLGGCGARSPLRGARADESTAPQVSCEAQGDCDFGNLCHPYVCVEGSCQPGDAVVCEDDDPCTADECNPYTGECRFRPLALDLDGDGFRGPVPGSAAGSEGACGSDCDDTSGAAHPGGREECDGVDNDCNGIVDDGARYEPTGESIIRVASEQHTMSAGSGLVFNGSIYGVSYAGQYDRVANYFKGLAALGQTAVEQTPIANVSSDTYSGPLIWTGSVFATVWEDRRDDDYEIYFNRLDSQGTKLGPDLRLSHAPDFSLHADLLYNGAEYLVVWDDRRDELFRVYGQRVTAEGELLGLNVPLTELPWNAEDPSLAEGDTTLGLSFKVGELATKRIGFRISNADFSELGELMLLSDTNSVGPGVVWCGDRYLVAWNKRDRQGTPGDAIWGAAVSETGEIIRSEQRLTSEAAFARGHSMLPLGDRVLLVWAAMADEESSYELYTKMLSSDLQELTPQRRITHDPGDTNAPVAAFGPGGDVGILFAERQTGGTQAYFTRLACEAG
jgi:hypothetical protein